MIKRLHHLFCLFGVNFAQMGAALIGLPRFLKNYVEFRRKLAAGGDESFKVTKLYPCLTDYNAPAGLADGQYFHQDLYVARRIFEASPRRHVDVGSRVDGFVAHVAAFARSKCSIFGP